MMLKYRQTLYFVAFPASIGQAVEFINIPIMYCSGCHNSKGKLDKQFESIRQNWKA